MHRLNGAFRVTSTTGFTSGTGFGIALLAAMSLAALGQSPATQQPEQQSTTGAPGQSAPQSTSPAVSTETNAPPSSPSAADAETVKDPLLTAGAFSIQTTQGEISEDQLKQLLVEKVLYLRGGYQDNNLEFDEQGRLTGHSQTGSFTLSQIQINKVKLSKRKLELEGDRYGLHFLGAAPYEDPTKDTDRVKITPKKKTVRISFDREQVEKPKKEKHKRKQKDDDSPGDKNSENSPSNSPVSSSSAQAAKRSDPETSGDKVSKTTDPAHASQLLITALDKVFSRGIDDRMIAAMPDFWKLYYKAASEKTDYKPVDPGIFFQNTVDQKARLISALDPPSNEFAQSNGVAGMALYHTVVGSDGKVKEVVAGRPIGFGLDENAEQTILKANFQPATKNGKPVPVALDLVVSFRIYSKRTSQVEAEAPQTQESKAKLPGPYSLQGLEQAPTTQQNQAVQQNQPATQDQSAQSTKTPQ